ncbi:hypothetical protein ACJIZ3_002096 [Penstemon smallii]|uniref:Uncharacterized protein n=1 Tax=Penstemon smallii TaxID=265156 RepID=A0ABD3U887_9LAMI
MTTSKRLTGKKVAKFEKHGNLYSLFFSSLELWCSYHVSLNFSIHGLQIFLFIISI